jgi:beta-glucosidase
MPSRRASCLGSTAAHQVEDSNTNSDSWSVEHRQTHDYAEGSNDACDHHYHHADDIKLVANLGFNTYRFSIEWHPEWERRR